MTNPTGTARQAIQDIATEQGWVMFGTSDTFYRFTRNGVTINVTFTEAGVVKVADRFDGTATTWAGTQGKRETVIGWLTAEPAAVPTVDEVAAAVTDPAWGQEPAADTIARVAEKGMAVLDTRIAELEAELRAARGVIDRQGQRMTQAHEDYAAARRRITELEDAPVRKHARRLVESLRDWTGKYGGAVNLRTSAAAGSLADALGMSQDPAPSRVPIRPASVGGTESGELGPELERDGHPVTLVLVDEVMPEVVGRPAPTTVREALALDAQAYVPPLRPQLPGESLSVQEYVAGAGGPPAVRVYGQLVQPYHGDEYLAVAASRDPAPVPLHLVLPYLAAVRGAGFPAPAARLALLHTVIEAHRSLHR